MAVVPKVLILCYKLGQFNVKISSLAYVFLATPPSKSFTMTLADAVTGTLVRQLLVVVVFPIVAVEGPKVLAAKIPNPKLDISVLQGGTKGH
jgi:hypothetical protein